MTKFSGLPIKEQKKFSEIENSRWFKRWKALLALHEDSICLWCKQKMPNGILILSPGKFQPLEIEGEFAFHAFSTHGFSPEEVVDMLLFSLRKK